MIPVDQAQAMVLDMARPMGTEVVPLHRASGRLLAVAVAARRDQPPFDASAMDGYAVGGDPEIGAVLPVIGESRAGAAFHGDLTGAIRISTGAPVPAQATRVIMQEHVRRDGDTITITELSEGRHIRAQGQDFRAGQTFAPRRLRPADIGLLAAMDVAEVSVFRRPDIAIISTGDELAAPGSPMRDDQIPASNAFTLQAMIEEAGATARVLPIATDDADTLRAVFALAKGADVVVTIGGASVGDHDLVGPIARELGMDLSFHKIAMRPGKPLMAGRMGDGVMLGLPGNPVSSFVCAQIFLLPLIRAMTGQTALPDVQSARLAAEVPANGPRTHFMRGRLDAGGLVPFSEQDSSLMLRLTEANVLLIRPPNDPARPAGDEVSVLPI
ncbi:molybdopterin molybdotransferase MoeA [Falsirhodobacter halotolerans]|uniref:molybdopterin molybdotransferase MoeA n=1 Tax=Falsirhodobacter halotolerans TaxID=1146892 RepID=UPI001FD393D3|nr:molybdopterin molybdotransferase MoeA [Falsirhodobacter halotolerans]MCJ8139835.1 molybdopterin molybdotransferase MoeA [Falsirhodobacter halotolerans]